MHESQLTRQFVYGMKLKNQQRCMKSTWIRRVHPGFVNKIENCLDSPDVPDINVSMCSTLFSIFTCS